MASNRLVRRIPSIDGTIDCRSVLAILPHYSSDQFSAGNRFGIEWIASLAAASQGQIHPLLITGNAMIVTTGNEIAGQQILAYLGIVRGIVVRSPSISQGLAGGLQSIFGGNIDAFTEVCDHARQEAYNRMLHHATHLGADAVIGMRYDATEFAQSSTEVLAYGTAVKLGRPNDGQIANAEVVYVDQPTAL